ncbi:MAG: hypothetical protein ABEK36_04000 [Candidatus Aenigmatarchaeota archaeon]
MVKYFHFNITDNPGLTPKLYPEGQTTYKTGTGSSFLTDYGDGNYRIKIDPLNDADTWHLVARFYDLWYDGSKEGEYIDLGYWWFRVQVDLSSESESFSFADYPAQGIPDQIPNIVIPSAPMTPDDALVYVDSYDQTGFTLTLSKAAQVELPINNIEILCRGGQDEPS